MSARRDDGFALLSVMIVLGLMLSLAFTTVAMVDTQTGASSAQRERDTAFNLAESVLNAQLAALSREWPGKGRAAQPYAACNQTSTSTRCPSATTLAQGATSPDAAGATWTTSVHDNGATGGTTFYSDALITGQPGYDANGDGRVWVRAAAIARGRPRTLVALARAEQQEEPVPQAALISGRLTISNSGNKTLMEANGGLFAVRCTPALLDTTPCLGHTVTGKIKSLAGLLDFLATQVSGATPTTAYGTPEAIPPAGRARLKATAVANGTYFASCPTEAQLTGQVVYIEGGNCSYTSNTQFNTPEAPGMVLMNSGSITFGGTTVFNGLVYHANATASTGWAVKTEGNAVIKGGVIVDGDAQMILGSAGLNIAFDPNAYRAAASYGTAGIIQNTWREIR